MKTISSNLRLFWQGTVLSYVALFAWLRPITYTASKIIMPLTQMLFFTFLGSFALVVVVGLSAQAATLFLFATMFLGIFQHTNVKTPHWLGYIVQRPESHTIHHGKGLHAFNYSDLPLFDLLFGTFRNPEGYEMETGFYEGASRRIPEMLAFQDVSHPDPVFEAETNT